MKKFLLLLSVLHLIGNPPQAGAKEISLKQIERILLNSEKRKLAKVEVKEMDFDDTSQVCAPIVNTNPVVFFCVDTVGQTWDLREDRRSGAPVPNL